MAESDMTKAAADGNLEEVRWRIERATRRRKAHEVLGAEDPDNVNQVDYDYRTPLHVAACEGHLELVKLLLKNGARPEAKDRWRRTSYDEAKRMGYPEVQKAIGDVLATYGGAQARRGEPINLAGPPSPPPDRATTQGLFPLKPPPFTMGPTAGSMSEPLLQVWNS